MKSVDKFYQIYAASSKVHLINHFKSLQYASELYQVNCRLNCQTFYIEAEFSHKTFTLYPQFLIMVDNEPRYTEEFSEAVVCFTGWRPYSSISLPSLTDKIKLKEKLTTQGLLVPSYATHAHRLLEGPVIVKNRYSSFGKGLRGPFRAVYQYPLQAEKGEYFEAFIVGRILKIGYWNAEPVYFELQDMPTLVGDGVSTIDALVQKRAHQRGRQVNYLLLQDILNYQNQSLTSVLPLKKSLLIDFRYESDFCEPFSIKEISCSHRAFRPYAEVVSYLGEVIFQLIQAEGVDHLFYTVDAILDSNNEIWILEVNTNPTVHQLAYSTILHSLYEQN